MEIINIIEQYRKEKRVHKDALTKCANLNKNMYANYMKGSKLPYDVAKQMLERLDKQILIIDKI